MDRAKKIRIVVIVPVIVTLIAAWGVLYMVLQAGMAGATPEQPASIAAGNAASSPTNDGEDVHEFLGRMSEEATPPGELEAPACSFSEWVGLPVDEEKIKAAGRPYRILKPDSMATMDYSPERINVLVDEAGTVMAVRCG